MKSLAELRADLSAALEAAEQARTELQAAQQAAEEAARRSRQAWDAEHSATVADRVSEFRARRLNLEVEALAARNCIPVAREREHEAAQAVVQARLALQNALRGRAGQEEMDALVLGGKARRALAERAEATRQAEAAEDEAVLDRLYARLEGE